MTFTVRVAAVLVQIFSVFLYIVEILIIKRRDYMYLIRQHVVKFFKKPVVYWSLETGDNGRGFWSCGEEMLRGFDFF
ncbi:MAG: hypothetical protein A2089_03770 [Elusimicrobia bacterium GWD2_63_28]|nr:MAG: hypothetical protein A2089_03770 [Elusimicrobia bacterium GWD2_63_28]